MWTTISRSDGRGHLRTAPALGVGHLPGDGDRADRDISLWVEVVRWDPQRGHGCRAVRAAAQAGPRQEPLLEAAAPIRACSHSAWEPPPKVTLRKGPPLAAVALSWPPVSAAQASWPPADALITLTAELTIRLSQTSTSQRLHCYSCTAGEQQTRDDSHMHPSVWLSTIFQALLALWPWQC